MSTPTLLVDVHNKPEDLFRTVKQRIEACRAKCKCDKEIRDPDALPAHRLERTARGRELPSYDRREIAAGGGDDLGFMFIFEDWWFSDDAFSAGPCGCEDYGGEYPNEHWKSRGYSHNDCGANWLDQISGYEFRHPDGLTGMEKFAGFADYQDLRNGRNTVHSWCDDNPIANSAAEDGGYSTSDCKGARDWVGVGANHRNNLKYIFGSNRSLGFFEAEDDPSKRIVDKMAWHNYTSSRFQGSEFYSTFGSKAMTGQLLGYEPLVPSPPSADENFCEVQGSYLLGSAVEYIARVVTNVNSGGSTNPQYYVFTTSGRDRDGGYASTQKRAFTIGDKVRLAVDDSIQPGPAGSEGQDWVGTIVALGYGTFNMDVCGDKLCNGVCSEAYIRGDIPGEDCPSIGEPPNCNKWAVDEWKRTGVWPDAKSTPDELLPPSEWPVIDPNQNHPNTSCNPNVYTVTGFRYTIEYSNKIPQRLGGGFVGEGTGPLNFHSYPGGAMYHAFPASGNIESLPRHKTMWSYIGNSSLDQWIVRDGEGKEQPNCESFVEEPNDWQTDPGGMVYWGGHGGKAYFTLEAEDFRYTTDANNRQTDQFGGFANYSSRAPYWHIENLYSLPQVSSHTEFNGGEGSEAGRYHIGPYVQVEGRRNSYNWDRSRCGGPDLNWKCKFFEFDCASGKISRQTGIHEQSILCNCDMSYGQIPWMEYTGNAAPDWWPWKQAWMDGTEAIWQCNETNTKAYAIRYGEKDRNTGAWIPGEVYSWPVDTQLLRDGKWEEFAEACSFNNAPEGGITTTKIPTPEEAWPDQFDWNPERPWPKPSKWGYAYTDRHWVPPK